MGDGALGARPGLLREQREELFEKKSAIESTIDRLSYKIEHYKRALETDLLSWDDGKCDVSHLTVSTKRSNIDIARANICCRRRKTFKCKAKKI